MVALRRFDGVADDAAIVDYKESPHSVLELVDKQLKAFGLEVVMIDTGSDEYEWRIERRIT